MVFILLLKLLLPMKLHPSFDTNIQETQRILTLHRKATKNHYLFNEQNLKIDTSEIKSFKLPNNTFPSGQYKDFNKTIVDNIIEQMNDYLKNYPIDQSITVEIESSESKVPTKNLGYSEGQLSRMRADEMEKYLKGKLPSNVKITKKSLGSQGPEWDSEIGKDDPRYTEWQYVSFNIIGQGKNISEDCNLGFSIIIDYRKEWCKPDVDESLCHKCDDAVFLMWANGIPILDKNDSSLINLNNKIGTEKSGPTRVVKLDVSEIQKKQILDKNPNEILITYGCALDKCHSDPIHVTIINSKGDTLLPGTFFSSGGKKMSKSEPPIKLLKMDKCGVVIPMSNEERFENPKPIKTFEKPFRLETDELGYSPESLYELYKFVSPDQIFVIPNDQIKKFRFYSEFQNKSWKELVNQLEINKKDLKRLSEFMSKKLN